MANQKAISARVDEDIYNMARDYATTHSITTNRLINRALEHYLLYTQYKDTAASDYMSFDEYYRKKQQHAFRPSRWQW